MRTLRSLEECKEASLIKKNAGEYTADFSLEGKHVYAATIGYHEFTLTTASMILIFVVDVYGSRSTCELFDWEKTT